MNNLLIESTLLPHLLDIVSDPAAEGLILAGGLGIQLKRQYLRDMEAKTLIAFGELPAVRPTEDIDMFLRMEFFSQKERGAALRHLFNQLKYDPLNPNWQFKKSLGPAFPPDKKFKLDLMARSPQENENVKSDNIRVGSKSGTGLHGRTTLEAFAVEDMPLKIDVSGTRTNGTNIDTEILVPHPYAWLNMKIKAAHDWLTKVSKNPSEKHTFDVYILTAMLTEAEIETATELALKYANHPIAAANKAYAIELYNSSASAGFREAARQAGTTLEYEVFWEALCQVLNIIP